MEPINIFVEVGRKKTFAGAIDWPGWCRWGKGEAAALDSLVQYAHRYAQVLNAARIKFPVPAEPSAFQVTERHEGNATTDFGAHDVILNGDRRPVSREEYDQWTQILPACWAVFDRAVEGARGRSLRKGPRGGGRDLEKIMLHVLQADHAYLRRLAWRVSKGEPKPIEERIEETRDMILQALEAAIHEGLPEKGPRGGVIWPPRFFVRRVAWHILDHAWEIEDRVE